MIKRQFGLAKVRFKGLAKNTASQFVLARSGLGPSLGQLRHVRSLGLPATFHGNRAQATIIKGESSVEVVAVMGRSNEECDKHALGLLPDHRGQLLLISRDEDNTSWDPRMQTLFNQVAEPTKEVSITDPSSAVVRVGYHDVLKAYKGSANEAELREALNAAFP